MVFSASAGDPSPAFGSVPSMPVEGVASNLGTIAKIVSPPLPARVIQRFMLQSLARDLLPDERVAKCLRWVVPGSSSLQVLRSESSGRAHYKNLQVCSSVWMCPVCTAKIGERRRHELVAALVAAHGLGLHPTHITLTLRHFITDSLASVLDALKSAFKLMLTGNPWIRLVGRFGWVGFVKALEILYSSNGWHVHLHLLAFLDRADVNLTGFEAALRARWLSCLVKKGFDASWENGLKVQSSESSIADYIAKFGREPVIQHWSIEHELTKAPVKRGRDGGRTPMQLLADYGDGDVRAGSLFVEYALLFKGSHQLQYSRGLRAKLGLLDVEKTDEELATEYQDSAYLFAKLSWKQWGVVLRNDARGELLNVASEGDEVKFWSWLEALGVEVNGEAA